MKQEAIQQGIPYQVTRYGIDDLDRAICDGAAEGFVKVLTVPEKGQNIRRYHCWCPRC